MSLRAPQGRGNPHLLRCTASPAPSGSGKRTDCQKVNCPEGAREATLGCVASLLAMTEVVGRWFYGNTIGYPAGAKPLGCCRTSAAFLSITQKSTELRRKGAPSPGRGQVAFKAFHTLFGTAASNWVSIPWMSIAVKYLFSRRIQDTCICNNFRYNNLRTQKQRRIPHHDH